MAHEIFVGLGFLDCKFRQNALEVLDVATKFAAVHLSTILTQHTIIGVFSLKNLETGVTPRLYFVNQGSNVNGRWQWFGRWGRLGFCFTPAPFSLDHSLLDARALWFLKTQCLVNPCIDATVQLIACFSPVSAQRSFQIV